MKKTFYLFGIILIYAFTACSPSTQSSEESTQNSDDQEIYVFDDVSEYEDQGIPENVEVIQPVQNNTDDTVSNYIVQVGAFTTEARAQRFVTVHQPKLEYSMSVSFSEQVNLYVVQLPPFNNRRNAEMVRDELWKTEIFKDAFIISQ